MLSTYVQSVKECCIVFENVHVLNIDILVFS